jgi:hypothetical protein
MPDPLVYLGCPHAFGVDAEAVYGLQAAAQRVKYKPRLIGSTDRDRNCNLLWVEALNGRQEFGFTHFAMIHSDVGPETFWLDKLYEEMQRVGADLISVILPMKDGRGLTTTKAIYADGTAERITMRQIHARKETFSMCERIHELALNTGLFLCRVDQPWVEHCWFETHHKMVKDDQGRFVVDSLSEDWNFTLTAARHGARTFATRCVKAVHFGRQGFPNDRPWGTEEVDKGGI